MENFGYKENDQKKYHEIEQKSTSSTSFKSSSTSSLPLFTDKSSTNNDIEIAIIHSDDMPLKNRNDKNAIAVDGKSPTTGTQTTPPITTPPITTPPVINNILSTASSSTTDLRNLNLSVKLCMDTIRENLIEQMNCIAGRTSILFDIEQFTINTFNVKRILTEEIDGGGTPSSSLITKNEKNIIFLWLAFTKHWELLNCLIECGADIMAYDINGLSALHLAAFSGCLSSIRLLIGKGIDLDFQPGDYTPLHCSAFGNRTAAMQMLLDNGADIRINTKREQFEESVLMCAIRVNAIECVQLLMDYYCCCTANCNNDDDDDHDNSSKININQIGRNGLNAIHLATELNFTKCLKILFEMHRMQINVNVRVGNRATASTALHLAADDGNIECIQLLLANGADSNLKNHRGFTALHLAARKSHLQCVKILLHPGLANPNAEDYDGRSPLHAAIIGNSELTVDILEALLEAGANVNHTDIANVTALHLAAMDGLTECVNFLLYNDANLMIRSKNGISPLNLIIRKTPESLNAIQENLNQAITLLLLNNEKSSNNNGNGNGNNKKNGAGIIEHEIEIKMDFQQLLKYCHPLEINYLNEIIDEGYTDLLKHPLCSAFLYLKWLKIRKYYLVHIGFYFLFVFCLSLYVLTALAHTCYNSSQDIKDNELCQKQSVIGDVLRNNPFFIEMQWWFLVGITIFEITRKLYGLNGYKSVRDYIVQIENLIEWFIIVSVFLTSYIYNKRTDLWQNHVAAFAVLLSWINLMLIIGQLPIFGVYIEMYTKVQAEFAKLFMAYSCMLIGFVISFCVVFPSLRRFENPLMGVISVLVMMVGEHDLSILDSDLDVADSPVLLEISAQIIFVLFHIFVTIILWNLLVGIAVDDIQSLKQTAELSKLVRQTKLIAYIESALFVKFLPSVLRNFLHRTALISPKTHRILLYLKPLNPHEMRIPQSILRGAFEIAKRNAAAAASADDYDKMEIVTASVINNDCRQNEIGSAASSEIIKKGLADDSVDGNEKEFHNFKLRMLLNANENSKRIIELEQEITNLKLLLNYKHTELIEKLKDFCC